MSHIFFTGHSDIILVSPTPSWPLYLSPSVCPPQAGLCVLCCRGKDVVYTPLNVGLCRGLSLISHSPSSERYSAGFNVGINATQVNNLLSCMESTLRPVVYLSSTYPTLIFGA